MVVQVCSTAVSSRVVEERAPEPITELLREAGVVPPQDDLALLREELEPLLAMAASLEELPLDGVPPAFGAPRWE
jgi:hypothetical protein